MGTTLSDDLASWRLPRQERDLADVERDITDQMHAGLVTVRRHLLAGRPGRGLYELCRSLQRQARVAGLGTWPIEVMPVVAPARRPGRHAFVYSSTAERWVAEQRPGYMGRHARPRRTPAGAGVLA